MEVFFCCSVLLNYSRFPSKKYNFLSSNNHTLHAIVVGYLFWGPIIKLITSEVGLLLVLLIYDQIIILISHLKIILLIIIIYKTHNSLKKNLQEKYCEITCTRFSDPQKKILAKFFWEMEFYFLNFFCLVFFRLLIRPLIWRIEDHSH